MAVHPVVVEVFQLESSWGRGQFRSQGWDSNHAEGGSWTGWCYVTGLGGSNATNAEGGICHH